MNTDERAKIEALQSNVPTCSHAGCFVVAINSRLAARAWCKEEDGGRASVDQAYWECAVGNGGNRVWGKVEMGVAEGPWDLPEKSETRPVMGRTGRGMRLHTPPRGLPHSDSPIRMSK